MGKKTQTVQNIKLHLLLMQSFFDKQIFPVQSKETLQYKETYKGHLYYLHKTPKSLRQRSKLPYHEIQSKPKETDCFILNTVVPPNRTMNGT